MTGILLAPDLPVEEVVFLTLLCYVALVLWRLLEETLRRRQRDDDVPAAPREDDA